MVVVWRKSNLAVLLEALCFSVYSFENTFRIMIGERLRLVRRSMFLGLITIRLAAGLSVAGIGDVWLPNFERS